LSKVFIYKKKHFNKSLKMMVTALCCAVDDFMKKFDLELKKTLFANKSKGRGPDCDLAMIF